MDAVYKRNRTRLVICRKSSAVNEWRCTRFFWSIDWSMKMFKKHERLEIWNTGFKWKTGSCALGGSVHGKRKPYSVNKCKIFFFLPSVYIPPPSWTHFFEIILLYSPPRWTAPFRANLKAFSYLNSHVLDKKNERRDNTKSLEYAWKYLEKLELLKITSFS